MKRTKTTGVLVLLAALALPPPLAAAQEPLEQTIRQFGPLISVVRGAVRSLIEHGKGCLPAAALAKDPADPKAFVEFGFTAEMVKDLGANNAGRIAELLNRVAVSGPFTAGAIGTCETDATVSEKSPNVIALHLELRSGLALRLRFPFEHSPGTQLEYVATRSTVAGAPPLIFRQAAAAAPQQPGAAKRPPLAAVLNTPEHQWVFNHICVPVRALPAAGYTNRDFLDAWYAVAQARWDASLDAERRGDQDAARAAFAPILHGMIDLYWPNRVERDASGAITRFRDCDELGNLQGMLSAEKAGPGPSAEVGERSINYLSQVMGKLKANRPFAEVVEILRSGPMKFSEAHLNAPLAASK